MLGRKAKPTTDSRAVDRFTYQLPAEPRPTEEQIRRAKTRAVWMFLAVVAVLCVLCLVAVVGFGVSERGCRSTAGRLASRDC